MFLIIQGDTVAIFSSNLFSMVRKVDYDRLFINHNCAAILWLSIWQEMDTRKWASFPLYREFLASQKKKRKKKTSWNIVVVCLTVCLRHRNSKCFFFFLFDSRFFKAFLKVLLLIFTRFHNQGRPYDKILYRLKNYVRFPGRGRKSQRQNNIFVNN